ncbi:MAG: hypothetical protein ACREHE_00940 [Rhizomicrobium sp.]
MTISLGFIGKTTVTAVTDTAADVFTAGNPTPASSKRYRLLIVSDVDVHLNRNADADSDTSMLIPADTIVEVSVFGGDRLSAIIAGETDGSVWATLRD